MPEFPRHLEKDETPESLLQWCKELELYLRTFDDYHHIIDRGWEKSSWSRKVPNRGLDDHVQVITLESMFAQISDLCTFDIRNSQFKGTNSF